jgi:anthranilate synthase component 2
MKVLLLDNYDSFTYNIAQIINQTNICKLDIIKNDKIEIKQVAFYDKILLSPGPDIPKKSGKMMQIIEQFYDKIPILGICLGMQAIVQCFGGDIYNMKNIFHGIKENITIRNNSLIFSGLDNTFTAGLYHSWAVSKKNFPKELKITALSSKGIIMAIEHNDFPVYGVQFHPESYMTPKGKKIIENWLKL